MESLDKAKNLKLFENVYRLVSESYASHEEMALRIAASVVAEYDFGRLQYAIDNNWDIHDIDRWELCNRYCQSEELKGNFKEELASYGMVFEDEVFDNIMSCGFSFLKNLVAPLYEQDVEIVELLG